MRKPLLSEMMTEDVELRDNYRTLLKDKTFKLVVAEMEARSRSYNCSPTTADAGAIGIALGISQGRQQILDEMQTLDEMRVVTEMSEEFATPPTGPLSIV